MFGFTQKKTGYSNENPYVVSADKVIGRIADAESQEELYDAERELNRIINGAIAAGTPHRDLMTILKSLGIEINLREWLDEHGGERDDLIMKRISILRRAYAYLDLFYDLKLGGEMGRQAFDALIFLMNARNEEDVLWGGQVLLAIINYAEKMNPNDRLKLYRALGYQAATAMGQNQLDVLQERILVRACKHLSIFYQQ